MTLWFRTASAAARAIAPNLGRRRARFAALLLAFPILLTLGGGAQAGAASPASGVTVQSFVSGLPDVPPPSLFAGVGPVGLAFNRANHLLVSDAANLGFYSFGRTGSTAPSPITTGNVQTGLAFGKHGQLFAALYQAGNIDQIDPGSGAFVRQLNPPGTTYPCVIGLAADPVSGDLFFGQTNSGGVCPGNPVLTRVENPASAHPTFVAYSAVPGIYYEGLAFAPDGTLYAVQQNSNGGCAVRISGTRSPAPPTITTIACFPNFGEFIGIETIALLPQNRDEAAAVRTSRRPSPLLFVAGPSGTITMIDQSTAPATLTPIVTLSTRIDGMVGGPDCRLYATQSTGVDRITNPAGACCQSHQPSPGAPHRHGRPEDGQCQEQQ
jgi:hypothetical protein